VHTGLIFGFQATNVLGLTLIRATAMIESQVSVSFTWYSQHWPWRHRLDPVGRFEQSLIPLAP
jgi:hypothetical protein